MCSPTTANTDGANRVRPWPTLSHHLRVLRDAGVTRTRQEGTRCFVTLRSDDLNARFPGLLNAVLDVAHRDGVGSHVGLAGDPPTA
ncbi:hypothetical protein SANTM175S_06490 [Streptomyces antimycoticus]